MPFFALLTKATPAPLTTAQVQLKLMDQERVSMGNTGQTSWIATGLKIEETQ